MSISKRVRGCMELEEATAEIYTKFMRMFPAEAAFWEDMILDEKKHSKLYMIGEFFNIFGEGDGQVGIPPQEIIDKSLEYARGVLRRINESPVSLEDALRMALELEKGALENLPHEMAAPPGTESSVEDFKKILVDELSHIDKISSRMMDKGFMKAS